MRLACAVSRRLNQSDAGGCVANRAKEMICMGGGHIGVSRNRGHQLPSRGNLKDFTNDYVSRPFIP